MRRAIIWSLLIINAYFITHIFTGANNIQHFLSYKTQIAKIKKQKTETIQQRYKLMQISELLDNPHADNIDIVDELLRKLTHASLPEEKIVLLQN